MAGCDRRDSLFGSTRPPPLACTFLAVGHGGCAVLELPQGQTILYDAGRMGLPGRANRGISSFLWSRGISHVDAVVLSHADADHYNALPELLNRFSVGVVFVSPAMFLAEDEAVATLRQIVRDHGVPLREIYGGDRFQLQGTAQIQVLHPLRHCVSGSDNANSIVLRVDYGGRTILLPGDLEGRGLEDVLAEREIDCDVLLAPHHGSMRSRPADMAAWCAPEWVVISGANEDGGRAPEQAFAAAGARVLHTARAGAVRVSIDDQQMAVRSWREQPW
jgi:competence protein ComEC